MEKKDFRIVFMGTPEFAVESLEALLREKYDIVAVITAPDKPAGRGKKLTQSAVKKFAVEKGLKVLQPVKLKDELFLNELKTLHFHLGVVVAFRMLPEAVWCMPPFGTINLHASLLPQYRGAAPINHVLMNGEKETGLTTFFLDKEIDTGKIILQERLPIGKNEYLDSLHDRMMQTGAKLLLKTVDLILRRKAEEIAQKQFVRKAENLKLAPKIFKTDCLIHWEQPIEKVYNHIRGLSPFPAPFTYLVSPAGEKIVLKIFRANPEMAKHNLTPGTLITDGKKTLKVAVSDGFIQLLEVQSAGRKRMSADAFLRGFPLDNNWRFESVKPSSSTPK